MYFPNVFIGEPYRKSTRLHKKLALFVRDVERLPIGLK